MSATLKVQPLKNVVLSLGSDARNYELLIIAEMGESWHSDDLTSDGFRRLLEVSRALMKELESEENIIEQVVLFGEWNDDQVLFRPLVRDYFDSWIAIGGRVEFMYPALMWVMRGLELTLGRVPRVAVVGGVLEDNVLLAANRAGKAFPESTIIVLTPLCLTEADYALDAPDAVDMMTEDDDDLSDEDDYDLSDDQG